MTETRQFSFANGIRISLPDTLEEVSTYVLQEQLDWHEEDIRFLRKVLRPGQQALDIGAGDGVYALSFARSVGPSGQVRAFEAASNKIPQLSESIAANRFSQIILEARALSRTGGTIILPQPDLPAGGAPDLFSRDDPAEQVPADTLDDYLDRAGWQAMDVVRFGERIRPEDIVVGGYRFFGTLSPLVLYGSRPSLIPAFAALGYETYRLAPGLNMLIPFRAEDWTDAPPPNLYGCKPDLAEQLSDRGVLVTAGALEAARTGRDALMDVARKRAAYQWGHALCKHPYGDAFADIWYDFSPAGDTAEVMEGLALHAMSRDGKRAAAERVVALESACGILGGICDERPDYLRQSTLARMASELGLRHIAVHALKAQLDRMLRVKQIDLSEPFLTPEPRFEGVKPGTARGQWALAMTLEAYERWVQPSSFFSRDTARERLILIRDLGYGNSEMERRLTLLERRYG